MYSIIVGIADHYKQSAKSGRDFIETTVGAAIFYLPSPKKKCWSGMISETLKKDPTLKRVVEHYYPRKIMAKELLLTEWDNIQDPVEYLKKAFYEKYGRYHYVSKDENIRLRPFQKDTDFKNPEHSYKMCKIKLVKE